MTFILYLLCYLVIGVLISIHGMRNKWLTAKKDDVALCVLCWFGFLLFICIDFLFDSLVKIGKGKDG